MASQLKTRGSLSPMEGEKDKGNMELKTTRMERRSSTFCRLAIQFACR